MGNDKFQILWFSGIVLGASVLAIGAFVVAVGIAGVALAMIEGMKLRG